MNNEAIKAKQTALHQSLKKLSRIAIAFSGGVDSVCLMREAVEALGTENVLGITVSGVNFPAREGKEADEFAHKLGVTLLKPAWDPFTVKEFAVNAEDRCYHCKKALYTVIIKEAAKYGYAAVVDGANASDADDYRPGSKAARELGIVSPLADAGLTKEEIRFLLRERGEKMWTKAAFACLATRAPTGAPVTPEMLAQIEAAEDCLLQMGFRNVRVRHHGDLARIEVDADERDRFMTEDLWKKAYEGMRAAGYRYAALDLLGYQKGNMNTV